MVGSLFFTSLKICLLQRAWGSPKQFYKRTQFKGELLYWQYCHQTYCIYTIILLSVIWVYIYKNNNNEQNTLVTQYSRVSNSQYPIHHLVCIALSMLWWNNNIMTYSPDNGGNKKKSLFFLYFSETMNTAVLQLVVDI